MCHFFMKYFILLMLSSGHNLTPLITGTKCTSIIRASTSIHFWNETVLKSKRLSELSDPTCAVETVSEYFTAFVTNTFLQQK